MIVPIPKFVSLNLCQNSARITLPKDSNRWSSYYWVAVSIRKRCLAEAEKENSEGLNG